MFNLKIYGTLCGPLEIPGISPVVHLDHVENHWFYGQKLRRAYSLLLQTKQIVSSTQTESVTLPLLRR